MKSTLSERAFGQSAGRLVTIFFFILLAASMRLLPHPPNFTPIGAMALFGGAYLARRTWMLLLPIVALFMSDLVLGFHDQMISVYASFALIAVIGSTMLRENQNWLRVGSSSIFASMLFFGLTNFAVWAQSGMYPHTWEGLVTCYVMALPFFHNTIAGDLFFSAALFGGFAFVVKSVPRLREV